MNYFAHALPFLDRPYLLAGTAVPDWLTVADRGARLRPKWAERLAEDPRPEVALVARGVLQHIRDDRRFHQQRAFAELSMDLALASRETLAPGTGFQPAFLGHLLVELLLDASLVAADRSRLESYWRALDAVDPAMVQQAVNRMVSRPANGLASMISEFRRQRILSDYLEDAKLLVRLNQVMRRVGLQELPEGVRGLLPVARRAVEGRRAELLDGIPVPES